MVAVSDHSALLVRESELRTRLEVGWQHVQPGEIRCWEGRYLSWFLELLREYEDIHDQLRTTEPLEGEIEVLVWPDCGHWVFDSAWKGAWGRG